MMMVLTRQAKEPTLVTAAREMVGAGTPWRDAAAHLEAQADGDRDALAAAALYWVRAVGRRPSDDFEASASARSGTREDTEGHVHQLSLANLPAGSFRCEGPVGPFAPDRLVIDGPFLGDVEEFGMGSVRGRRQRCCSMWCANSSGKARSTLLTMTCSSVAR